LDIGSSKISACLAVVRKKRISDIFFEDMPVRGIKEGVITDSIDLVNSVSIVLKNLKNKSRVNFKSVCVNISGRDIVSRHSRAIMPLAERGNKVITYLDIRKANEQARILGANLEEEIVQVIPSGYAIDSKSNINNPAGLYSHRLEADLFLVCVKLTHVQSLNRVINQAGYEIKGLFFSGAATSIAACGEEFKNGTGIFCDIGSDITEILIFKSGLLKDIEILALGGNSLTEALKEELKIPFELAEDIKRAHGIIGNAAEIAEDKEILVKKSTFYKPIKQKIVAEAITNSALSACQKIKEAIEKKLSCYEVDNFVVCGRAVLLEGFIETLENTLSTPVKVGRIASPLLSGIKERPELSGQKYLSYLTALGILAENLQDNLGNKTGATGPSGNFFSRIVNRLNSVYQEYF